MEKHSFIELMKSSFIDAETEYGSVFVGPAGICFYGWMFFSWNEWEEGR
jgi:hypothetical protein